MAHYYLDSSALVKRYVAGIGTTWVINLCAASNGHTLYVARITGAEIVAALFRRARSGALNASDAQSAATRFKYDFRNRYQVAEVTEPLIDSAMSLAEKHGLRGYDSVQLATALELQSVRAALSLAPITFVCADEQLNAAAMVESLLIEDPNTH